MLKCPQAASCCDWCTLGVLRLIQACGAARTHSSRVTLRQASFSLFCCFRCMNIKPGLSELQTHSRSWYERNQVMEVKEVLEGGRVGRRDTARSSISSPPICVDEGKNRHIKQAQQLPGPALR